MQPTQISDISADLVSFFHSMDPATTLLDVANIATAALVSSDSNHGGLSGSMQKIALTYANNDAAMAAASALHRPPTIIVKTTKDAQQSRDHAKAMQLPREGLFLKHIQALQTARARRGGTALSGDPSSSSSSSPFITALQQYAPSLVDNMATIYYSNGSMAKGEKLILCEDLTLGRKVAVTIGADNNSADRFVTVQGIQSGWLLGPHSILNRGIADLSAAVAEKGWRPVGVVDVSDVADEKGALLPIDVKSMVLTSFLTAAELHGAFWMKPVAAVAGEGASDDAASNAPLQYLRGAKWYTAALANKMKTSCADGVDAALYAEGKAAYEGSQQLAHTNWVAFKDRVKVHNSESPATAFTFPPAVETLMETVCPTTVPAPYDAFLAALASRPHTLVHGDFHPGNMVVYGGHPSDGPSTTFRIALLDWEVVGFGSGPQDIGQYMTSHFTKGQFDSIALDCVLGYVDALVDIIRAGDAHGDTAAALRKTITQEVCLGALGRWAWLLGVMGGMSAISLDAMQYFVGQVDYFMQWSMANGAVLGVPSDDAKALAAMVGMPRP